jgi:acyl-CoA synthetase (AMP-forming)/AMP-acid ligase II
MRGLMMDRPLLVSALLEFGAEIHASAAVVSRRLEGDIHRYSYREAAGRAAQLAHALHALGVAPGDRVGTMAWNGYRHFEVCQLLARWLWQLAAGTRKSAAGPLPTHPCLVHLNLLCGRATISVSLRTYL